MREIKFRVYDNDTKTMHVCGDNTHDNIVFIDNKAIYYNLQNGCDSYKDSDGKSTYELMQWTGFKDKNGVDVYEGDILGINCYSYDEPESDYFGVVGIGVFGNGLVIYEDGGTSKFLCFSDMQGSYTTTYEVFGNIHDNPELVDGVE